MGGTATTLTKEKETTTFLTQHAELNTTAAVTHVQTVDPMHETQERTELKSANKNSAFDKTKKEDAYALSKSEVRNNYSDKRADAFQGNLHEEEEKPTVQLDATGEKYTPEINSTASFTIGYVDRRKDVLFPHEPSLNDVRQRFLGECYLQAGLSTLVMDHPEKLKEGIKDNGDGTVTVRFFKDYSQLTEQEKEEYHRQKMEPVYRR